MAAFALAISACGSDDEPDSSTTDTDPPPADTSSESTIVPQPTPSSDLYEGDQVDGEPDDVTADTSSESTIVPQPTPSSDLYEGDQVDGEPDDAETDGDAPSASMDPMSQALTDTMTGQEVESFLTLVAIVGIDEVAETGDVTVFAPSDQAFEAIADEDFAELVDDPLLVRDVLESHIVEGAVQSGDLEDGMEVTTISGESLTVAIDGDTVMIGDATVTRADIPFDNGVVHVIDSVLDPAPV